MPVNFPLCSDYCFKTRKHCLKQVASILACNVVAVLLIRYERTMDIWSFGINLYMLLTVARQPVIYTRFLFHPGQKPGTYLLK